jgi:Transposase IS4
MITWPVFKGQTTKWLHIPTPIDDYNHAMNGVDIASQFRGGYSCHKPNSRKWWKPILFWLFDIYANNAYLIWRLSHPSKNKRQHKGFIDQPIDDMLRCNKWTLTPGEASLHRVKRLDKPKRCVYGYKHAGACVQGPRGKRKFGQVISGIVRRRPGPRQVLTACEHCTVALCIQGGCWQRYHDEK